MEAPVIGDERQRRRDPLLEDRDPGVPVCAGDGQPNPILEDVRDVGWVSARIDEEKARMIDLGQLDP